MPKAVPDHCAKRSPTIPNITGNAEANPNPVRANERIDKDVVELSGRIIQPVRAKREDENKIILAGNFFNNSPTVNLPTVNTAEKNVNKARAVDPEIDFTSIR